MAYDDECGLDMTVLFADFFRLRLGAKEDILLLKKLKLRRWSGCVEEEGGRLVYREEVHQPLECNG